MEGHTTPRAPMLGRADGDAQPDEQILDATEELGDRLENLDVDTDDVDGGLSASQHAALVASGRQAIVNGVNSARERLEGGIEDVRYAADMQHHIAETYASKAWDSVDEELGLAESLGEDSQVYAAIEATFTRMVSAAVTLIVGIYVFAQISGTMPTPDNPELANSTETVTSTTGNAFTLGAVAIIVLVAGVILSLVGGFGGGGRRGRR